MKRKSIMLYDTTLRDGAQGEGVSFTGSSKVQLALRLDDYGFDYIEGGYAASNERDMAFFHAIRRQRLKNARIVAFGSTRRVNTRVAHDAGLTCLLDARTFTVTIVGKSWKLHVADVLRTTAAENLAMIAESVRFLKQHGKEVFFDAEHFYDGYTDDPAFAVRTLLAARDAGADCLVLCDTNGGTLPHAIHAITKSVVAAVRAPIGIHTHDDAGMATAGAIEAVRAGAAQVQGTINGIGERCGNANLCAIIPALQLKLGHRVLAPKALAGLRRLSLFAGDLLNMRHDGKAPYVGESAFAHKGGLHVNAVQKNPRTFEHIRPELVGNQRRVLLSDGSGMSSLLLKAAEMGLDIHKDAPEAREVLKALKDLEHRGYAFEAADASFHILLQKVFKRHRSFFDLEGFRVIVEKRGKDQPCLSEATIKVRVKGEMEQAVEEGDGPVNALDKALRKVLLRFYPSIAKVMLTDFRVRILDPTEATAAKTRVVIESSDGEATWGTVGVSENIIEAAWQALVDSVEYKLFRDEEKSRSRRS